MNNTQNGISDIAIISYHSPPALGGLGADIGSGSTGGMSTYLKQVAGCLDADGINVAIFTTNQVKTDKPLDDIVGENIHLVQIPTGEPTSDKNELKGRRDIFAEGVLSYYRQNKLNKPDIIYSNYWQSFRAAEALKRKNNEAILLQNFHSIEKTKENLIPGYDLDKERIAEEKRITGFADGIIVSTIAGVHDLRHHYGANENKIHIAPPGVNTGTFYPMDKQEAKTALELPQDGHVILSAGRLDPMKNYSLLIEAFGLEIMKDTNSRAYIIGGNKGDKERIRLENKTEENNIEDKVNFIDHMSQQDLALWYNAADVLVVPSLHETFGLVALEAMACGTPVIASDVGGLQYLVVDGDTGYLIPPNNPVSLAKKLKSILEDKETREDMGAKAWKHSKKYYCETMVSKLFDVFKGIQKSKLAGIRN